MNDPQMETGQVFLARETIRLEKPLLTLATRSFEGSLMLGDLLASRLEGNGLGCV